MVDMGLEGNLEYQGQKRGLVWMLADITERHYLCPIIDDYQSRNR